MAVQRLIEDYDDYYDVCQELHVTPVGMQDDNFYLHWEILEKNRHKLHSFGGRNTRWRYSTLPDLLHGES
jgi:hypothetical protein